MRDEEKKEQCGQHHPGWPVTTDGRSRCTKVTGHLGNHRAIRGEIWAAIEDVDSSLINQGQDTAQCRELSTKRQRCIREEGHQELHLFGAGIEWSVITKDTPELVVAAEQPQPKGLGIPVAERLIELIHERTAKGVATYGEPLTTHNGRDAILDSLQESVDLNQYLMQVVLEQSDEIAQLSDQIGPLADYLLSIGGPDRDESACDMAVRLLKGFDAGGSANKDAVI